MKNSILRKMYAEYVNFDEYSTNNDVIEMDKIRCEVGSKIQALVGDDLYIRIESDIAKSECESEFYGFAIGFKTCMRLLLECTSDKAVKA